MYIQFYLTEQQLGSPKAQASAAQLAELNPYVPVHVLEGDALTEEAVKRSVRQPARLSLGDICVYSKPRLGGCGCSYTACLNTQPTPPPNPTKPQTKTKKSFRVVCLCDQPLAEQLRVNGVTHPSGIAFIAAEMRGAFAGCFCDFGPEFHVRLGRERVWDGMGWGGGGCVYTQQHACVHGRLSRYVSIDPNTHIHLHP